MSEGIKSFLRVLLTRHIGKHGRFGTWVRIPKATTLYSPDLTPARGKRVPIGVTVGRLKVASELVIILRKPSRIRTVMQIAEEFPTAALWHPEDFEPMEIEWHGISGLLRREPKYTARIYVPKPIAERLGVSDETHEASAALWQFGEEWIVLVIKIV